MLISSVTGNTTITLKAPKKERAMPLMQIKAKVSTMNKNGHIEWATTFAPRTAAALRKQMRSHVETMVNSPEYPTTQMAAGWETSIVESVRPGMSPP